MRLSQPAALVLDSTPLGLLVQKLGDAEGAACKTWLVRLEAFGCRFFVPEIADFALRRVLLRSGETAALARLDAFVAAEPDRFLPLATPALRLAATLWAQGPPRDKRRPPPSSLTEDCVLAAQARLLVSTVRGLSPLLIATDHPERFRSLAPAHLWREIDARG